MGHAGYIKYELADIKLPINFSPKMTRFTCEYAGKRYEHADINELKQMVLGVIKASFELTWTPVIELRVGPAPTERRQMPSFSLWKDRLFIGYHSTVGYKQVVWDTPSDQRLTKSREFQWKGDFQPPVTYAASTFERLAVYLPYSEETWQQLNEIEGYLSLAAKRLHRSVTSPQAIAGLLQVCHRLFDAATQEEHGEEELMRPGTDEEGA